MFKEGALTENRFSFNLAPSGSELYLGGIDPKFVATKEFRYTPVVQQLYWAVGGNVLLNGKISAFHQRMIIDTGTTLIIGPKDDVEALFLRVPGSFYDQEISYWTYPCSAQVDIAFSFAGSEDYTFPIPSSFISTGHVRDNVSSQSSLRWLLMLR